MTWGYGITTKGVNTSGTTVSTPGTGINTQASGSLIICAARWRATQNFSGLADNKGNTYTQIGTEISAAASADSRLYYCENAVGGTDHQWTLTLGGSTEKTLLVLEITGGETSGSLDKNVNASDAATPFSSTAAATTTQADELLVGFCAGGTGNPVTWTIDASANPSSGWVERVKESNASSFWAGVLHTREVTATDAYIYAVTMSAGTAAGMHLATFKMAIGAGTADALPIRRNRISVAKLMQFKGRVEDERRIHGLVRRGECFGGTGLVRPSRAFVEAMRASRL